MCREPSSSEPAVLDRACFASCTGQIHDTACSTARVCLYPVMSCIWALHLSSRLYPSTAGCSPPSMPSICSVHSFPVPDGSLLLCYVVLPSSTWLSPRSLPSPWLPLCAVFSPSIVLHSCYMSGPFPLLFQCVYYQLPLFISVCLAWQNLLCWTLSTNNSNSFTTAMLVGTGGYG